MTQTQTPRLFVLTVQPYHGTDHISNGVPARNESVALSAGEVLCEELVEGDRPTSADFFLSLDAAGKVTSAAPNDGIPHTMHHRGTPVEHIMVREVRKSV